MWRSSYTCCDIHFGVRGHNSIQCFTHKIRRRSRLHSSCACVSYSDSDAFLDVLRITTGNPFRSEIWFGHGVCSHWIGGHDAGSNYVRIPQQWKLEWNWNSERRWQTKQEATLCPCCSEVEASSCPTHTNTEQQRRDTRGPGETTHSNEEVSINGKASKNKKHFNYDVLILNILKCCCSYLRCYCRF